MFLLLLAVLAVLLIALGLASNWVWDDHWVAHVGVGFFWIGFISLVAIGGRLAYVHFQKGAVPPTIVQTR